MLVWVIFMQNLAIWCIFLDMLESIQLAIVLEPYWECYHWKHITRPNHMQSKRTTNTDRHGHMEGNIMLKITWILLSKISWWNSHPSQTPCYRCHNYPQIYTLKKDNGIKPIGVEKCLQRFIGKAITQLLQRTSFM